MMTIILIFVSLIITFAILALLVSSTEKRSNKSSNDQEVGTGVPFIYTDFPPSHEPHHDHGSHHGDHGSHHGSHHGGFDSGGHSGGFDGGGYSGGGDSGGGGHH